MMDLATQEKARELLMSAACVMRHFTSGWEDEEPDGVEQAKQWLSAYAEAGFDEEPEG